MDKISIILADDHAILRDGIRALLDLQDDIELIGEACDGKEAFEKALDLVPDIVVMDIGMSGMDGLEATRRIKKKLPGVKVLILSQHEDREYILSAIRAGAAGFVPKRALGSDLVWSIRAVHSGNSVLYPTATTVLVEDYLRQSKKGPYERLTDREREVLKLIADGHTSKEIAEMLFINFKTVLGHRAKLMEKLDIHNRSDLVKFAIRQGLVSINT